MAGRVCFRAGARILSWPQAVSRQGFSRFSGPPPPSQKKSFVKFSQHLRPLMSMSFLGLLGFGKNKEEEEEDYQAKLVHNIKLGILAFQKGDLDKAEQMLHIALRMAQDMGNQDGITYIFDQLANVAFAKGDLMKSERLFKDVIERLLSQGTKQDDNKIIEMSLKLACIYGEWKQDEKAIVGFRHCIATQEKKVKAGETDEDTLALWGMAHDMLAQFLLERNHFKEALGEFQAAYDTCCELFGEKNPQSIVLINSLGAVSSLMEDHTAAVNYFEKAVKLSREINDAENLSTYLVNMGMAKLKQGLKKQALDACNEAWRSAKRSGNAEVAQEANDCIQTANSL